MSGRFENTGRSRALSLLLVLALALSSLTAALTVARLHDHDCAGEDCTVCHIVSMADAVLGMRATPQGSSAHIAATQAVATAVALVWWLALAAETPIQKKDKLLI